MAFDCGTFCAKGYDMTEHNAAKHKYNANHNTSDATVNQGDAKGNASDAKVNNDAKGSGDAKGNASDAKVNNDAKGSGDVKGNASDAKDKRSKRHEKPGCGEKKKKVKQVKESKRETDNGKAEKCKH
ncbi:high mobility group nucleosome-binding domain-containing protein 5-like isoform X2 [Heterodontus francisci]|uniref:high mobility group nucleosome-binding domain-containing protein 5-like isoform X2 n=1 Tax=Heterodontus francisci TaxID=7792 RepID=UPI00355B39E3